MLPAAHSEKHEKRPDPVGLAGGVCMRGRGGGQIGWGKHGSLRGRPDQRHAGGGDLGQGLINGYSQLGRVGAHIRHARKPGQQRAESSHNRNR